MYARAREARLALPRLLRNGDPALAAYRRPAVGAFFPAISSGDASRQSGYTRPAFIFNQQFGGVGVYPHMIEPSAIEIAG